MSKILTIVLLLISCEYRGVSYFDDFTSSITLSETCEPPKFTKEALKCYIIQKGILHPEIVYAQAVLETGNFKSCIFRENNNLFGMKLAKVRPTTAIGYNYGHAAYNNWQESVDDYLLWQQMWQQTPIHTESHYFELLDRLYAEDPRYVEVVKIVKERNELI